MSSRDLAQPSWRDELDSFSRKHAGWRVSLRTTDPGGEETFAARDVPLIGVARTAPDTKDIEVALGDRREHVAHIVADATAVRVELTAEGADRALVIDSADGTRTTLQFASPMRSEEVDGVPDLSSER